jgi:acyl carrier protein
MELDDIKPPVREYVLARLEPRGVTSVADDESLIEAGIVDSLGVFQLIAFLEDRFGVRIQDHEILLNNFHTVDAVVNFVAAKLGRLPTGR